MYKVVIVTKETYEANCIEIITDKLGKLWLNERHLQQQLRHKNLYSLTNKYDKKYKKKQSFRKFIHNYLALKIIMDCRTDKSCNLKRNLGFKLYDMINTKEQTVINSIKGAFEGENLQTQYTVLSYRIDLYFRINPDATGFNIFKEINKIHRHIKKSSKKSLIYNISKRLLELEFKSNHSIKSKCLKWVV